LADIGYNEEKMNFGVFYVAVTYFLHI